MAERNLSATAADEKRRVRELGWWYQDFELPSGVRTGTGKPPSYKPDERWRVIEPFVPDDLAGKSILDVGGNAGYFSIQMKLRGAGRCVLLEPYEEFVAQAKYAAESFRVELEVVNEDVHTYCLTTEERFDYVLFLGLFYHLKYPGIVLDRLAEMTKERIYLHSYSVGDENHPNFDPPEGSEASDAEITDPAFPHMKFIEGLYNDDPTNWWFPSHTVLEPLMRSAGIEVVARPHTQLLVGRPDRPLGKTVYPKLVFPNYAKPGGPVHPGPQRVDPKLWERLLRSLDAEHEPDGGEPSS